MIEDAGPISLGSLEHALDPERDSVRVVYEGHDLEFALQAAWMVESIVESGSPCSFHVRPELVAQCELRPDSHAAQALSNMVGYSGDGALVLMVRDAQQSPTREGVIAGAADLSEMFESLSKTPWDRSQRSGLPLVVWTGMTDPRVGLEVAAALDVRCISGSKDVIWSSLADAKSVATDCSWVATLARARGVPVRIVCGPDPLAWEWSIAVARVKKPFDDRCWMRLEDPDKSWTVMKRCSKCVSVKGCHAPRKIPCSRELDSKTRARAIAHLLGR